MVRACNPPRRSVCELPVLWDISRAECRVPDREEDGALRHVALPHPLLDVRIVDVATWCARHRLASPRKGVGFGQGRGAGGRHRCSTMLHHDPGSNPLGEVRRCGPQPLAQHSVLDGSIRLGTFVEEGIVEAADEDNGRGPEATRQRVPPGFRVGSPIPGFRAPTALGGTAASHRALSPRGRLSAPGGGRHSFTATLDLVGLEVCSAGGSRRGQTQIGGIRDTEMKKMRSNKRLQLTAPARCMGRFAPHLLRLSAAEHHVGLAE